MDISLKRKAAQTETVRSPTVAGGFYPDSPQVLSAFAVPPLQSILPRALAS